MRLLVSIAGLALLFLSSVAYAAQDPHSQPNCFTLHDVPAKVVQEGTIPCKCGGSTPAVAGSVSLPVGGSGASVTLSPGPSGSNGGLVCYQAIWIYPPHKAATPGGTVQAELKPIKVLGFHETCNLSGCRSALWGLFTWGGPACDKIPFDTGRRVPHYEFTGFCSTEP